MINNIFLHYNKQIIYDHRSRVDHLIVIHWLQVTHYHCLAIIGLCHVSNLEKKLNII